jgi:hypothetical protein
MATAFDPQQLLARDDKWFIGGGRELIYAPELPLWTDVPGFWPFATWLEWRTGPLFTVTVLDERGEEMPAKMAQRRWTPSHVVQEYALPKQLRLVERRAMTANDALVSELTLHNKGRKALTLNVVVWTCVPTRQDAPGNDFATGFERDGERFVWTRRVKDTDGAVNAEYAVAFGTRPAAATTCVSPSETIDDMLPWWRWTPFYWKIRPAGLPNEFVTEGGHVPGMANAFIFAARHVPLRVPAGGKKTVTAAASVAATKALALEQLDEALAMRAPIEVAIKRAAAFFGSVPRFRCSDAYIERAYWYRWWGMYLDRVVSRHESLPYPCVFEGMNPGWFRHAISYSAQVHMLECRWMHDPALAQGSLLNFLHHQQESGHIPHGIFQRIAGTPTVPFMYHANWGLGVRKVYESHPDDEFLRKVYGPLSTYARYFDRDRDRERSGLYDVINQGETGQEYMGRYLFTDEHGDQWRNLNTPLKGVDATVYIYELKKQLGWMAGKLGRRQEAKAWAAEAETIKRAVLEKMWDPARAMFCDVHPVTGQRSPHDSTVCFYPFMTDIAGREHVEGIRAHLLNPAEFWLPYPVPSTSAAAPYFSADGEWKGERKHCTWAGPSWLMTNSHMVEALANAARTLDGALRPCVVELITKFVRMLFIDGRLDRPTSYEYYHPLTGKAPFFRATDDYMHSWIVELILKYLVGVQTLDGDRLAVEPLDFGLRHFSVERLRWRGHDVAVTWRARKTDAAPKGLTVSVDGKRRAHADTLTRLEIAL